jgi:hypothetical protein
MPKRLSSSPGVVDVEFEIHHGTAALPDAAARHHRRLAGNIQLPLATSDASGVEMLKRSSAIRVAYRGCRGRCCAQVDGIDLNAASFCPEPRSSTTMSSAGIPAG